MVYYFGSGKVTLDIGPRTAKPLYRFGVVSDVHVPQTQQGAPGDIRRMFQIMRARGLDEVFCCGDITTDSNAQQMAMFTEILAEFPGISFKTCAGNHDFAFTDQQWNAAFGTNRDFVVQKNGAAFVFMSPETGTSYGLDGDTAYSTKVEWLDGVVRQSFGKKLFLFMHVPLRNGGKGTAGLKPGQQYGFTPSSEANRRIREILSGHRGSIVFTGHSHFAFEVQTGYQNLLFDDEGAGRTLHVHVPSLSLPRDANMQTIHSGRPELQPSQAYEVRVYEDCVQIEGLELNLCRDTTYGDPVQNARYSVWAGAGEYDETAPDAQTSPDSMLTESFGQPFWPEETDPRPEWDSSLSSIDYRKISTPDTTMAVIASYDYKYPTSCPIVAVRSISAMLSDYTDHMYIYTNEDATSQVFLQKLEEGSCYHMMYFYVNGHAANQQIVLNGYFSQEDMFNALSGATNRFVGFVDTCYAGSMIEVDGAQTFAGSNNAPKLMTAAPASDSKSGNEQFIDYIKRRFEEQKTEKAKKPKLMKAAPASNEPQNESDDPMFQLFAACESTHQSWYTPHGNTMFVGGINTANRLAKNARYDEMWENIHQYGQFRNDDSTPERQRQEPQRTTYGESFDKVKTWL